jgi:hypothetical protein
MKRVTLTACLVASLALVAGSPAYAAKAAKKAPAKKDAAAAASFVTVKVSSDACAGDATYNAGIRSKIYAKNSNKAKAITARIKYDTNPAGLTFQLLDADEKTSMETFPLYREFTLAPGEQEMVGCTTTYRTIVGGDRYMRIGISATLDSAAFSDAAKAPEEDAMAAGRFMTQAAPDQSVCQSKQPAFLYLVNTHPSREIAFTVAMADRKRKPAGEQTVTLAPMSNTRLGCAKPDKVNPAANHIASAKFVN